MSIDKIDKVLAKMDEMESRLQHLESKAREYIDDFDKPITNKLSELGERCKKCNNYPDMCIGHSDNPLIGGRLPDIAPSVVGKCPECDTFTKNSEPCNLHKPSVAEFHQENCNCDGCQKSRQFIPDCKPVESDTIRIQRSVALNYFNYTKKTCFWNAPEINEMHHALALALSETEAGRKALKDGGE